MAESGEALQLKRRARRRVVGAVALVTFVVIILPLILDKEPGPAGPPLSVQIPDPASGGFNSRVAPAAPLAPVTPAPPTQGEATQSRTDAPAPKSDSPAVKAPTPAVTREAAAVQEPAKPPVQAADNTEGGRAEAAPSAQAWVVMLDAFSDSRNVKQLRTRLSAAGLKSYTEPVKTSKGELTRVRAGPFASREAADKARAKLIAMGLKPGAVVSR